MHSGNANRIRVSTLFRVITIVTFRNFIAAALNSKFKLNVIYCYYSYVSVFALCPETALRFILMAISQSKNQLNSSLKKSKLYDFLCIHSGS